MKKAFLVKASVMTRVVVDVPEDFDSDTMGISNDIWDNAEAIAIPRLKDNLGAWSIEEIEEDFECPYEGETDSFYTK